MDIQDTKEQRQAFEAWCIQWNIASVFPLDNDGQYKEYDIHLLYCAWLQGQAAKAKVVPEWISVEDSLPNRQVNVLVASKHNFVCIASLTNNHKNNKFYDGDSLAINSITHWMPLPKPPKSTGAN